MTKPCGTSAPKIWTSLILALTLAKTWTGKLGLGQRRPLRRFLLWQAARGKYRAIGDALYSGHKEGTFATRRVHTSGPAFVVGVARRFWRRRQKLVAAANLAGVELTLQGGADDKSSAYRWKPTHPDDHNFSVVAFWSSRHNKPMFMIFYALAFGSNVRALIA